MRFSQHHGMLAIWEGEADLLLNLDLGHAYNMRTMLIFLLCACCYSATEVLVLCKLIVFGN